MGPGGPEIGVVNKGEISARRRSIKQGEFTTEWFNPNGPMPQGTPPPGPFPEGATMQSSRGGWPARSTIDKGGCPALCSIERGLSPGPPLGDCWGGRAEPATSPPRASRPRDPIHGASQVSGAARDGSSALSCGDERRRHLEKAGSRAPSNLSVRRSSRPAGYRRLEQGAAGVRT